MTLWHWSKPSYSALTGWRVVSRGMQHIFDSKWHLRSLWLGFMASDRYIWGQCYWGHQLGQPWRVQREVLLQAGCLQCVCHPNGRHQEAEERAETHPLANNHDLQRGFRDNCLQGLFWGIFAIDWAWEICSLGMVLGSARSHQGRSASFLIQAYLYVFFSKSCCQTKCASNKKLIQDYSARSPCYFIALLLFQHVLTCLGVRCSQHVKCLLQDKDHLDLLWEAALSVTVQVRFCSGLQENSLARNLQSEAVKALGHASLSDSFAVFSRLVKELQTEKVQDGVALGLAYNGTVYNAAIHKAALVLGGILDQTGQPVEKRFVQAGVTVRPWHSQQRIFQAVKDDCLWKICGNDMVHHPWSAVRTWNRFLDDWDAYPGVQNENAASQQSHGILVGQGPEDRSGRLLAGHRSDSPGRVSWGMDGIIPLFSEIYCTVRSMFIHKPFGLGS